MAYRIGYIGFGSMVSFYHYKTAMREDVPFEPTAAFDLREEARAAAAQCGLKVFDNLQDFLDSRLFDLVLVATPNQYHCPMACAALEAGYHVMCEKPVAMTSAEVEKMIETARKAGKMFTVHHNRRWDNDAIMMKDALETGKIGKLLTIENRILDTGDGVMFGWRCFDDHGGGMFGDWGVHMLDQLLYIIQEPIVSVWGSVKTLRSPDVDDWAKVLITFESGLTAQVESTDYAPLSSAMPKWFACGEKGAIMIKGVGDSTGVMRVEKTTVEEKEDALVYPDMTVGHRDYDNYKVTEWEDIALPVKPIEGCWESLYKNLAGVLDGTEELVVKPEEVLRCFKVIEAARESSKTGMAVAFK